MLGWILFGLYLLVAVISYYYEEELNTIGLCLVCIFTKHGRDILKRAGDGDPQLFANVRSNADEYMNQRYGDNAAYYKSVAKDHADTHSVYSVITALLWPIAVPYNVKHIYRFTK